MAIPTAHSSSSTQVWILRHGERIDHVDKEWSFTALKLYDPPLTPRGHIQAKKAGEYFKEKGIKFTAIYCSPLTRCLQTASEVAQVLDLSIHVELGAAEYVCARWTPGLTAPLQTVIDIEEICAAFPRVSRDYFPHRNHIKELSLPESDTEVNERMLSTLYHKSLQHEKESILIVSHGQMFWETRATWLGRGLDTFKLPYAAIAGFERDGENWSELEDMHGNHWINDPEYLASPELPHKV